MDSAIEGEVIPAKRRPPAAGKGRPKGAINKSTKDVRAVIAILATNRVHDLENWIVRTAKRNPAKAADLLLRALEYHIPKVSKLEVSGPGGGPVQNVTLNLSDPAEAMRQYARLINGG